MMFAAACLCLMAGFPVAFTLAGTALAFAALGHVLGVFDIAFLRALPQRIYGTMTNEVLVAVPLFVFMGVMLERSRVAEDLLEALATRFGKLRGGLGLAVTVVGALLAASTGVVGATVVTMGLLALPAMLRHGYSPSLAAGSIAAAGTLGQIIPPSIVLVILADQLSNAYQKAQLDMGLFRPETLSVGDLFAGALVPGLLLVGLYLAYQLLASARVPRPAPSAPSADRADLRQVAEALVPPLVLIVAVLGSILVGVATPTEAASVGAVGAILLAGRRIGGGRRASTVAGGCLVAVLGLAAVTDLRGGGSAVMAAVALVLCAVLAGGLVLVLWRLHRTQVLRAVVGATAQVTSMIFVILIGATLFSLVFRGLGGEDLVEAALAAMPGGTFGALFAVMALMFLLGFFLDFLEIVFVVVPLVAPALLRMEIGGEPVSPVWLGVLMAVNLQTSFLTPPFGVALFYLRGVAPVEVTTGAIYRGIVPFVALQVLALFVLCLFPGLATWLPRMIYG
ncbi:TRAP transporter large permease [Lutibaculum baratangense]|nr:TRAP transporter large permease subunit [Lutibaculum baratangense]